MLEEPSDDLPLVEAESNRLGVRRKSGKDGVFLLVINSDFALLFPRGMA